MSTKRSARNRQDRLSGLVRRRREKTRRCFLELLEDRCMLASDWQNALLPVDVDNDQRITARDALIVINELNQRRISDSSTGKLPMREMGATTRPFLYDVNGDGLVSSEDVHQVFAYLASDAPRDRRPPSSGGIPGPGIDRTHPQIPEDVLQAFYYAADLTQYTPEELESATGWVVLTSGQPNAIQLTDQLDDSSPMRPSRSGASLEIPLGRPQVKPIELISDTHIVSWDSSLSGLADQSSTQEMVQRLQETSSVLAFYPLVPQNIEARLVPNDEFYEFQWHLKNRGQRSGTPGIDINIERAWDRYLGNGIVIGIVDDGLQRTHPDLAPNTWINTLEVPGNGIDDDGNGWIDDIYGWDFVANDNDPSPPANGSHGTAVAGVAAARGNNSIGVTGVAPQAQLAGIRLLPLPTNLPVYEPINDQVIAKALGYQQQQIHIFNNSWGPPDRGVLEPIGPLALSALRAGVTTGRNGLGNIFVWAGGNGYLRAQDNSNYDGFANSRYVIAVGANDADGVGSFYSEPGANLLVTAPSNSYGVRSAIATTDLLGADGDNPGNWSSEGAPFCNPAGTQDYTNCFSGTSAAAPEVAGIVALMLEANPDLTWRDVKHILVESSRIIHPDQVVYPDNLDLPAWTGWQKNIAGKFVNHEFGFGMVDALAAVHLAESWKPVEPEVSSRPISNQVGSTILDGGPAVISTASPITLDSLMTIETVEVVLNATHEFSPDLEVVLTHTSPTGDVSQSILANQRVPCQTANAGEACPANQLLGVGSPQTQNYRSWKFSSVQHWGESTSGTWTLSVRDVSSVTSSASGVFDSWSIQFHGTESPTPVSLKAAIRDLDLEVTGVTVIVPGFEPFDEAGGSMQSLATAIRDRARDTSYNDTSWLLTYDSSTLGFDPAYSNFPVFAGADFGGQLVHSTYSGNYAASGSDVSVDENGNETNLDSFLVGKLGNLSTYVPGSLQLSFRYDPQDIENSNESLSLDIYHNGTWQTGVWSDNLFLDDGDFETNRGDWLSAAIPLGSLGITNWSDVRFRMVASGNLDTLASDEGGTKGVDEILVDDIRLAGNLISAPSIPTTIFFEDFENPQQLKVTMSDPDWQIVRGSDVNRWGEIVVLFDWAEESRRLSSGWSEAAGSQLFSLLTELGLIDPGRSYTADPTTDDFTVIGHDFVDGDRVRLVAEQYPGGTDGTTFYYVINSAANTFQISLTKNGSPVDITSFGAGLAQGEYFDLHIIGAGTGAVVASEAVERMATYRIPVDHLTYLDPHDFDQGQVSDSAFRTDFVDQPLGYGAVVWNNVEFADVYYQTRGANRTGDGVTDTLVPEGRPIPGAVNYWIGPGGSNYLPNASNYEEGNVLGDHRYLWEGFYLSTVNGLTPATNATAGRTKDTPAPASAIPVNDIGYAFSRVKDTKPRPSENAFFGYNDRGNWQDGTLYEQGDVVKQGSTFYAARRTHTADGPTESQLKLSTGTQLLGRLSGDLATTFPIPSLTLDVTIGSTTKTLSLPSVNDLAAAAASLQTAIRAASSLPAFTEAFVVPHEEGGQQRLIVVPGLPGLSTQFTGAGATTWLIDSANSTPVQALLSAPIDPIPSITSNNDIRIDIGGNGYVSAQFAASASTLSTIASELQSAIRSAQTTLPYTGARVAPVTLFSIPLEYRLLIIDGPGGGPIAVQELSNRPSNSTYWMALPGAPKFQDHRHSPEDVARGSAGTPDFAELYQSGFTSTQLVDARWQPQWNPNDVFNGQVVHVGDDILQRGQRTVPGWTGQRTEPTGPTIHVDLVRNVMTLAKENPSVVYRSLYVDPNAESVTFQMRVAKNAANDTLRVYLSDTLLGTPIAIPAVTLGPSIYAFPIQSGLRGQVHSLRFELDGAFDGIVGKVEIGHVGLEGYTASIKAGDVTQIDLGAAVTGVSAFSLTDPPTTPQRQIILDANFSTNGKLHVIPTITNSNGKSAEFAPNLWINFKADGVDKTLRVDVRQGYSVEGNNRIVLPSGNSVGASGTNFDLQVRRVQQRLRYLNFRGHTNTMVPVDGNGTGSVFVQALKLFEAATRSPGPGNPAVALDADGLVSSGDSTLKWLNSPGAPGWTTLREELRHPSQFDFRQYTTTWTHQALENALQLRPELHRIEGERHGFFSLTVYPDADPILHGPDRSGLAFGMEIEQGALNATGPAIDLTLPLDLDQPAITDAEREIIRDILAIRSAVGTEMRNVLIGGTGAQPDHSRLRSILTALDVPNQAVTGHGNQIHMIVAAPNSQAAITTHVQTALLNTLATLKEEVVDAIRMQSELQNRLFTKHPEDSLESLLPMELALQKGIYDTAVAYFGSSTSPTIEGLQHALDRLVLRIPIPNSEDVLNVVLGAKITAIEGQFQAAFQLHASRLAPTDQGIEDERLNPALDILDYEDATNHIVVEMDFDFDVSMPLQNSPIDESEIHVRRDSMSVSARSFNIRDYEANLFIMRVGVTHDPVILNGTLDIVFDAEDAENRITLANLKDPFLSNKISVSASHNELSGYLPVQPIACVWIPVGENPVVTIADSDIFDGLPPSVSTNLDFDSLNVFGSLTPNDLFSAVDHLHQAVGSLVAALEPSQGIPFVDTALKVLVPIESYAGELADALKDGDTVLFRTLQDLVQTLRSKLGLSSREIYFDCSTSDQALYLNLDLQRLIKLPIDFAFQKSLAPLTVSASIDAELSATMSIDLSLGFDLVPHALTQASYLNSLVSGLNGGKGMGTVAGDDIRVTLKDGTSYLVDMDQVNPTTIQDAYDAIVAPSAGDLTYEIILHPDRDEAVGVKFHDSSGGTQSFTIERENNSPAGGDLGILGMDFADDGVLEGVLRTRSMLDRIFLVEGGGLQIVGKFEASDIDASIGVAGVGGEIQNGQLDFTLSAGLQLVDPGSGIADDQRLTLRELFGSPLASTVDVGPIKILGEGRLPVVLKPSAFNSLVGIDPNHPTTDAEDGPELTVSVHYEFPESTPQILSMDPQIETVTPNAQFQYLIDSMSNMSFHSVCGGITNVIGFLRSSEFALFNQKLPLLNKSIHELIEADSLLSDVIDVLCVDLEQLKEDVEAILPALEKPTAPVGAIPAMYASLTTKQQARLLDLREEILSALGQDDLSGLPTDLTGIVGGFRDFMAALPNTVNKSQLNAFANQLEALIPALDKIETRVEAALGLDDEDFVMEFVDLDNDPETFTRGLVFRLTLDTGFNDNLSLDFALDTLDGKIPIGAKSGGAIQLGLNGTLQLDFGIDLSEDVDMEDRLFMVAYDGSSQGTKLTLTANAHTDSLAGSLSLGGVDLVTLGPADVNLRELKKVELIAGSSQSTYSLAIPNTPSNVLETAFVRVGGQMRVASSYTLSASQLVLQPPLPLLGQSVEVLYPGTNPASYTLSLQHVVTPDDYDGDPERIIRFSRLFNASDTYTWEDDFLDFGQVGGMLGAHLPLAVPLISPFAVRAFWDLSNPASPYFEFPADLGTQLGASNSCNFPGIATSIHSFLTTLEKGLASDVLEKLPLIGKLDLDQAGVFVHDVRQIVDPMLIAMTSSTALRSYLFENLGPGTPSGTGLKLDILVYDDDDDSNTPPVKITSLNHIGIGANSGLETWVNIPTSGLECIQFNLHLGGTFSVETDFDLGLGGVNIEVNTTGGIVVSADYDVQLGFGLNKATGAYVILNADQSDPEIELTVGVNLAPNTSLDLRLFFLQLSAAENVNNPQSTGFELDVLIDLTGPSNPSKLMFQEIVQTPLADIVDVKIEGDVIVDLTLTAGLTNPLLPSIKVDLWVDWGFDFTQSQAFMGREVNLEFRDLRLNLGGYVSKVAQPIVQKIDESLKPLDPLIEFLGKEIPLISDVRKRLGQGPIKVLDMVRIFGDGFDSAVDFITQVIEVRQIVKDIAAAPPGTAFEIKFGHFQMGGAGQPDPRSATNIVPSSFPASFFGTAQNLDAVIAAGQVTSPPPADPTQTPFANILKKLRDLGVEFPLLSSPQQAFGILFGQPIDFVTYDFLGSGPTDRLQTTFTWSQNFGPLLPPVPLYAQIGASFTMFADFKVGFDSAGLKKGATFTDGFYFDDTRPVLGLEARFTAGAELNAGLAWGGVRGGVGADIGASWNDINNDGKFRLKELVSRFEQGPHCVFDLGGEMNVFLEVYGGVGIKVLKKVITIFQARKELLNATIFKFNVACPPVPPPVLAHVTNNTLVLNIGPHAHLRQPGAKDNDEQIEVFYDTDSDSPNYQKYVVSGFGQEQAYSGVQQIFADGGAGNDQITIAGSVTVPVTIYGGDGNDNITVLRTGTMADPNLIYGGAGNDRLVGGPGVDHIFGNDGDDIIIAGAGDDYLEGNAGDDSLDGGEGDDILWGGDGDDDLDGGPGADQLFGEAGNDRLAGGPGQNMLYGGDGDDFIEGGDDPSSFDIIEGGAGNDIIHGKAGNDIIYGGDGNDIILGGDGDDHLYGEAGDDQIDGGLGNDRYYFDAVSGVAEVDTLSEPTGNGVDLLDFSTLPVGDDLTMNLTSGTGRHVKRTIRLINPSAFENVTSGAGDDTLIDNVANNLLIGGSGNDRYVFGAFPVSSSTHIDTIAEVTSGGIDWIDFRDLGASEPVLVDLSGSGILIDPVIALHASRTLRTLASGQHNYIENIRGGSSNDHLRGNASVNHIQGGPGEDLILGLGGNDLLEGNAGVDLIYGGNGDDTIEGGTEDDEIYGEMGDDLIRGGDGDDLIYGNQGADEIYGDAGNDLIYGNEGPDRIYGGDGDDVIFGNDGDDYIEGNRGRDLVWGGNGNDRIFGNEGDDRLFGQAGDDFISGGPGRDILIGDIGNDELLGGSGNDLLSGGADTSNGFLEFVSVTGSIRTATGIYSYAPRLFGDRLDGGSGHDLVLGGNITLTGALGGPLSSQERLAYEVFIDVLRDLVDEYQESLTSPVPDEVAFVDFLKSVTTPISSATPDGDDILFGGSENDLLIGHDGEDYLFGDHGRDTLIPYRIGTVAVMTRDWIEGGPDDDRLLCGTYADNVLVGGTSDLNLQKTLLASTPFSPLSVGGGYVLPSCVIDETPALDPVEPVSLDGQKFLDRNGNQIRDFDEPGLNGWTIELRDLEGEIIATTTTMSVDLNGDGIIDPITETGLFSFTDASLGGNVPNFEPGTYQITEAALDGFVQTYPLTGGQFLLPSGHTMTGVEVATGPSQFVRGYAISLQSGEEASLIAFGNAPLGELRGFKYDDLNGNGSRDANEPFLPGWQITIQDAFNNTQTITTDSIGRYSFPNLLPGSYTVTETIPVGWVQSSPGVAGGFSHSVQVDFGELVNNLDFGNVRLASVSGVKWEDANGDGIQDANESAPSQPFWIRLMDSIGNPTFVQTDANGNFSFAGLYPGLYTLSEIVPTDWVQTYPTGDSFGEYQFIVKSGDDLNGFGFGNYQQSSITGIKWNDLNGNGIYESSSEPVIPGWQLYLDLNENGTYDTGEPTSVTDGLGVYQFNGLAPGSYTVAELPALGWIQSFPGPGTDKVHRVTLTSGTQAVGLDFGNAVKSSIVGIKWLDLNGDGVRDPNEPGLPNWRIFIDLNQNGQFDEADPAIPGSMTEPFVITQFDDPDTPMDESGWYQFDDLLPGTYALAEELQDGWHQSYPGGGAVGNPGSVSRHVITLNGQQASGVDFGNYRPATIEGIKWHDVNGDGRRQLITSGTHRGDVGIGGWTIYLDLNQNGILDRDPVTGDPLEPIAITTQDDPNTPEDEGGRFIFTGLQPGVYIVAEEAQQGWLQSLPAQTGRTNFIVSVTEGGSATLEFANSRAASITGVKWWDQNLNRLHDASEPLMANWVVYLDLNQNGQLDFGTGGTPSEPFAVTNTAGAYSFNNLLPGFYVIAEFPQPHWSISYPSINNVNRHFQYLTGDSVAAPVSFGNTVFGDCNYDLRVGQDDQQAFNAAFHSTSLDPRYVSCFDFDQDDDIDFADLYVFAGNLGAQASMPSLPVWAQSRQPRQPLNPILAEQGPIRVDEVIDPFPVTQAAGSPSLVSGNESTERVHYAPTNAVQFGSPQSLWPAGFYATTYLPISPFHDFLFQMDDWTASLNPIGPTEPLLIGLAEASDGTVYGVSEEGNVVTISLLDGSSTLVNQFPIPMPLREGDIAIRPGDVDRLWIATERVLDFPPYLFEIEISSGHILTEVEIPLELSEFGFSGMQFLDANTLYLYEPQTNKLVITDTFLNNPVEMFLAGGPNFATRAGIDFDSNGTLWIAAKPASQNQQNFLYTVNTSGSTWQMIAQQPWMSTEQWTSLLIIDEYQPPELWGSIQGTKWHDLNGNGIWESNEPGLANWQIVLNGFTDQNQPYSLTTFTDQSGWYEFDVPFGTYVLSELQPHGWMASYPAFGYHEVGVYSEFPTTGMDFGNFRSGTVYGTKYESFGTIGFPVPDWEIVLTGTDVLGHQVFRTAMTMTDDPDTVEDETGQYWFADLLPGTYRIEEIQQAGWFVESPEFGFYELELLSGEDRWFDFYNYRGGTIIGMVYQDFEDCDGPFSSIDVPLANAVVYIDWNDDGILNRDFLNNPIEPFAITSTTGFYQFDGLPYGDYRVRHETSPGYSVSHPLSQSYLVSFSFSGQVAAEIDFGVFVYTPLEDGGDLIYASYGDDTVYGDNIVSNRCVLSYGDNDRIHGEQGNDLLIGQRRNDTYFFLPSSEPNEIDIIVELEDHGTNDRDDEGLHDRLDFSSLELSEPVEVNLSGTHGLWPPDWIAFHQVGLSQHTVTTDIAGQHNHIEDVLGGSGDDSITGNAKVNWLNGGPGSDLLLGLEGDDTFAFGPWNVGDVDTVIEAGGPSGGVDTLDFSAISVPVTVDLLSSILAVYGGASVVSSTPQWFENVIGGPEDDWIRGNAADNRLEGGPGNDTYLFQGVWGNDLVIELPGQGTDDVLDFSGATGLITSTIGDTSLSVSDGLGNGLSHTGIHIERLETGANLHHVIGGNSENNWTLDGIYTGILHGVRFSNAPAITGGPQADRFTFLTLGQFLSIDGGNGSDTIAGPPIPNTWQIDAPGQGGTNFVGSFVDIEAIEGGIDADSLQGPQYAVTWQINQPSGGTLVGYIDFSGFEQLDGGEDNDDFELEAGLVANLNIFGHGGDDRLLFGLGSSLTGTFDGGAGWDALDYSLYGTGIVVDLQTLVATGLAGFTDIESVMGTSWDDVLIGANVSNTWTVNGNQGTLNGLSFEDFENLEGGSLDDTYDVLSTVSNLVLRGNDGDDLYSITFGSLLGLVQILDDATSTWDRIELYGTAGDDAWVIDANTASLSSQQVMYDQAIEELWVFGDDGDDTFDVIPSLDTEMFLDGGNHNTGDTLTVDKLGQSYIDNGDHVLVDGYQPVNYENFEQVAVPIPPVPNKPKSKGWEKLVDDLFSLETWWLR